MRLALGIVDFSREQLLFVKQLGVDYVKISGAMVSEKVDTLVDTGAKEFVTTDCGCLMNIAGYAEKNQKPVTGQHILSFLWERTSSGGEPS